MTGDEKYHLSFVCRCYLNTGINHKHSLENTFKSFKIDVIQHDYSSFDIGLAYFPNEVVRYRGEIGPAIRL